MAVRITRRCNGTKYLYGGDTTGKRDPIEREVTIAKGRVIEGDLDPANPARGLTVDIIELPNGDMVFLEPGNCEEIEVPVDLSPQKEKQKCGKSMFRFSATTPIAPVTSPGSLPTSKTLRR